MLVCFANCLCLAALLAAAAPNAKTAAELDRVGRLLKNAQETTEAETGPAAPQPPPAAPQEPLPPSAFERYVAGGSPAAAAPALEQFGYDLFLQPAAAFEPVVSAAVGPDYILGPGDEIRVRIWGKVDLKAAGIVDRAGKLDLPRIGVLPAAGYTIEQMRHDLKSRYDRVFGDYQMDVSVGALRSIGVFVVGHVRRPGRYAVSSLASMLNALVAAGGPTKSGTLRNIQLVRNGEVVSRLDLYELLLSGRRSGDVRLEPEDTVFVAGIGPRVALAGCVRTPAIYELTAEELTFEKALEIAGGLSALALRNRIQIERVNADGALDIIELDPSALAPDAPTRLRDGDIVRVFGTLRKRTNVVYITGNVSRPGAYEYREGMRVADLLAHPHLLVPEEAWAAGAPPPPAVPKAQQEPFPEPFWEYALIRRIRQPDLTVEHIPFNLRAALFEKDAADNQPLQPHDTVIVFSRWQFVERPLVHVGGAVNRPGAYPLTPGLRLADLVSLAGGLKPFASRSQAELLRVYYDESAQREECRLLNLSAALANDAASNIQLRERDYLFVRSIPEHKPPATVLIEGEVRYPGTYPIQQGERLSSLLERAGGFSARAYLRGAALYRESVRETQQRQLDEMISRLEIELGRSATAGALGAGSAETIRAATEAAEWQRQMLARLRAVRAQGRVVVRMAQPAELAGSPADLALEPADRIIIPPRPDTVSVLGAVYNQSAFLHEPGATYLAYLRKAGGMTQYADTKSVYVILADGSVVSLRQGRGGLHWDSRTKRWVAGGLAGLPLEPGDAVVVPQRLEHVTGLRLTKDITEILYQIAVTTGVMVALF